MPNRPPPVHSGLIVAEIAGHSEVRRPQVLDEVGAVFGTQRLIEPLRVDEPVAGQRGPAECAALYENVVSSDVDSLGIDAERQPSRHCGSDACAAQDVEIRSSLTECLV